MYALTSAYFALLTVGALASALARPFHVPSANMEPTAPSNSYVFANMAAYLERTPSRGDIVIFKHGATFWIKRVVGLPGDRIQMRNGILVINGTASLQTKMRTTADARGASRTIVEERLFDGTAHMIQDLERNSLFDSTREFHVPKDQFFVLGDNRDNSVDSRDQRYVGFVARDRMKGRVWGVLVPWSRFTVN